MNQRVKDLLGWMGARHAVAIPRVEKIRTSQTNVALSFQWAFLGNKVFVLIYAIMPMTPTPPDP